MPQSFTPRVSEGRRRWTTGEVAEILAAITTLRTSDIARTLGVSPKALRSLLRRHGISLRALRESAHREDTADSGLVVRRSSIGVSATYGAAALEALPDGACHWPHGDPAEPDFFFCGAPVAGNRSYCSAHLAQAFRRVEGQ
ncbi:MAG: GcrA family cell cycle regulator [Rhodomicrobium sp.]